MTGLVIPAEINRRNKKFATTRRLDEVLNLIHIYYSSFICVIKISRYYINYKLLAPSLKILDSAKFGRPSFSFEREYFELLLEINQQCCSSNTTPR